MKMSDFKNCKTPVILCSHDGRVLEKNPSAKKNLIDKTASKRVIANGAFVSYGKYRGFCCEREEGMWAVFPAFAQFDFDGCVFHFAEDAVGISCEKILSYESALSSYMDDKSDTAKLWRVRSLLLEQFSIVFKNERVPLRLYSANVFADCFSKACAAFYPHFGAQVQVVTPLEKRDLLINVRNVTVMLTAVCTLLLSISRYQHVSAEFSFSGDYLTVRLKGQSDKIPFTCENERGVLRLIDFFPDCAVSLLSTDVMMECCGYFLEYDILSDGTLDVRLYFKAEKDISDLLDKGTECDLVPEIGKIISIGYFGE